MSKIKELVVISGKGGTGKTTVVAAFAGLAENKVMADCDVDAADLHLILTPDVKTREDFVGGVIARKDSTKCISCGKCLELCKFDAITEKFDIDSTACEGCGVCAHFCPENAISMDPRTCGEIFISETRFGPMAHAKLGIAEENSGKLVTEVRKKARAIAEEKGYNLIVVDGSPGIGCPVIASLAGTHYLLIITEPTVSGLHDMERVVKLSRNFKIEPSVCINKYDINPEMSEKIKDYCQENNVTFLGKLPYDRVTTKAMIEGKNVIEYSDGPFSQELKTIWNKIISTIEKL